MTSKKLVASKMFQSILATALVLTSASASAERYIVFLKSNLEFAQVHSQVSLSSQAQLSDLAVASKGQVMNPFAGVDGNVEASLENLKAIVINSESAVTLQALKSNSHAVYVEKEFFHPGPKPVNGYKLTSAWDFQVAYIDIYKKRPAPVQPSPVNPAPTPNNPNNGAAPSVGANTPWGIIAVKAPEAWAKANAGLGARVAVIDTGIDKDHPALAPNFEQGQDFIGDGNQPYAFADKVGHGSHCAGTIAGAALAGGFVGVAPKAKLLSARVCSEQGCSNIAVAQAINWAVSKKVDVISMSLGGDMSSPAEQSAIAAADQAGVVVVAAAGNDGTAHVSFPAALPTVIAVGAVDKTSAKASFSQWGPQLAVVAPGVAVVSSVPQGTGRESNVSTTVNGVSAKIPSLAFSGSPEITQPQTADVVAVGLGQPEEFAKVNVKGKIALVQRGTIKFADKVKNAIAAEAAGLIVYNNDVGIVAGAVTTDGSTVSIPVVGIEQSVGLNLVSKLNSGAAVSVTISTAKTDFESYDGTSMATPHVAGVSALVKAANKNLNGAAVKSILMSTATALQPNDQNQFGAGLVNASAAVSKALGQ